MTLASQGAQEIKRYKITIFLNTAKAETWTLVDFILLLAENGLKKIEITKGEMSWKSFKITLTLKLSKWFQKFFQYYDVDCLCLNAGYFSSRHSCLPGHLREKNLQKLQFYKKVVTINLKFDMLITFNIYKCSLWNVFKKLEILKNEISWKRSKITLTLKLYNRLKRFFQHYNDDYLCLK